MKDYKNGVATFIMPLYVSSFNDVQNIFAKSIEGILDQSDQNFQIIIIDDYSPKDFYNQVELYIEKLNDKRIHLIRCKKNRGPGYCRNVGIKYAYKNKSPIILYNDSDDISDSNRLKVVRKIFVSEEEVDVVYSTFIPINERDEVIEYDKLGPALKSILDGNNDNPISERNSLIRLGTEKNYTNVTSSTAVRTELAYNNLFPKYRVSEDAHTWYRYAANGGFFYYSPNIPTKYRIKSDGKSTTRIKQDSFCEKKIKAYSSGFKKAISIYSQKNFLTKNEKTKILHDFCLCLYKTIEREASKKTLLKVERKIKKYSDFLDINIFDKEKHVLQIIVPQKEGRVGGSDTHVLALSNTQQVKSAFSPIILFTKNNEYLEKIKKMDISYIYTGNCKNKIKMLRLLSDIPKKYNIEIIHSHQYNANYLAVIIKLILYKNWHNIPLVMTCHGWIENNFKDRFYTFWDFFTYLFARALICVSKKDILRLNHTIFKRKKKYYIPNGVLIAKNGFKQNKIILEKHNIPEKKIIISYVGRLAPEKRLDLVIKIAEIVCKKIDNVIFLISGSGEQSDYLAKKIIQKSLQEKIYMAGYVSNIQDVYDITDICILTSDTEGTPRAILEAMSNKIPVVSTNVGGLKEIIDNEKNGLLIDKGNYMDFANKLIILIKDKRRRENYGKNGFETILKKFNIETMQHDIEKVYNKVLKAKR